MRAFRFVGGVALLASLLLPDGLSAQVIPTGAVPDWFIPSGMGDAAAFGTNPAFPPLRGTDFTSSSTSTLAATVHTSRNGFDVAGQIHYNLSVLTANTVTGFGVYDQFGVAYPLDTAIPVNSISNMKLDLTASGFVVSDADWTVIRWPAYVDIGTFSATIDTRARIQTLAPTAGAITGSANSQYNFNFTSSSQTFGFPGAPFGTAQQGIYFGMLSDVPYGLQYELRPPGGAQFFPIGNYYLTVDLPLSASVVIVPEPTMCFAACFALSLSRRRRD